jgi:hypothetical protein
LKDIVQYGLRVATTAKIKTAARQMGKVKNEKVGRVYFGLVHS